MRGPQPGVWRNHYYPKYGLGFPWACLVCTPAVCSLLGVPVQSCSSWLGAFQPALALCAHTKSVLAVCERSDPSVVLWGQLQSCGGCRTELEPSLGLWFSAVYRVQPLSLFDPGLKRWVLHLDVLSHSRGVQCQPLGQSCCQLTCTVLSTSCVLAPCLLLLLTRVVP